MRRILAVLSSAFIVSLASVAVGPATHAGAVTLGYSCSTGFVLKVKVTGTGSVNTLEEPQEKFKVANVVFKILNPFSSPMTVSNVSVTVPDPPTVAFLSGSTTGAGWVFSHPGISTDTHAGTSVVPVAGALTSGAMTMKYRDVSTDPPGGPGFVQWFGGTIGMTVISPAGLGTVTCTPLASSNAPFAAAKDPS